MDIKITKKQQKFIHASQWEVLFGGAAGGGKSFGQLIDAFLFALKYPKSQQLILRRTYPELEKSLVRTALSVFPSSVFNYQSSKHLGNFKNGSILDFGFCENENDVFKYQSAEYDVIRFDELTHFTESMYIYLLSRVRGVNKFPKQVKSSTNPGGVGHSWVKKRFVDIGSPNIAHKFPFGDRIFIPSKIADNAFLMKSDPDYVKRLKNLPEHQKRALLYGDWDIFDGQFFGEFRRELHVCDPFPIPSHWRRYLSIDYGMDMLCGLFVAMDSENNAFVYKELYEGKDNKMGANGQGHIVTEAVRRIKEETGDDKLFKILAPPDLFNRNRDSGLSTASIFRQNGLFLTKAPSNRKTGWLLVREFLKPVPQSQGGSAPKLHIFSHCKNIIRCLPLLQFDKQNPDDTANFPHEITHAPDALRYFAASMPQGQQIEDDCHFEDKKNYMEYSKYEVI